MDFLVSNTHLNSLTLIGSGFIIGVPGGFFGVGGNFLGGASLDSAGVRAAAADRRGNRHL